MLIVVSMARMVLIALEHTWLWPNTVEVTSVGSTSRCKTDLRHICDLELPHGEHR